MTWSWSAFVFGLVVGELVTLGLSWWFTFKEADVTLPVSLRIHRALCTTPNCAVCAFLDDLEVAA